MSTDPSPLIHAEIVSDGVDFHVPERMGQAREDQLQGTVRERIAEIAGRVCYDSLGKGRSSFEYHKHIQDVRHLSVYEHTVFTVEVRPANDTWLPAGEFAREKLLRIFINRPGVWVRFVGRHSLFVTLNARCALEWGTWSTYLDCWDAPWARNVWYGILQVLRDLCPQIAAQNEQLLDAGAFALAERSVPKIERGHDLPRIQVRHVQPQTDDEQWATMLLCGSRGFSHELVRHGDFTAISQRSTRYVDESESMWVEHPLIAAYREAHLDAEALDLVDEIGDYLPSLAREVYSKAVKKLQAWLLARGVDNLTALKQARGAARGYLGNALYTEVIFSANVAQWRRMIAWADTRRASDAADAEIRAVFVQVLRELRSDTQVSHRFQDMQIRPANDGIGEVVDPCLPGSPAL